MGSKKEQALEYIRDMRSFVELHIHDSDVMYRLFNMIDDLKDTIDEVDLCQCSKED